MSDYENLFLQGLVDQLKEMRAEISRIGTDVSLIKTKQEVIQTEFRDHIAATPVVGSGGLSSFAELARKYAIPVIMALVLAGMNLNESLHKARVEVRSQPSDSTPSKSQPIPANQPAVVDQRRINEALVKKIMEPK